MKKLATLIALVAALLLGISASASASFTITEFSAETSTSQAGAHPDVTTNIQFPSIPKSPPFFVPDGDVRTISVQLPPGIVGDPSAVRQCSQADFIALQCPAEAQVGLAAVKIITGTGPGGGVPLPLNIPVFNMQPRNPDTTGELAFFPAVIAVHLPVSVRTDGDFGLTTDSPGVSRNASLLGVKLKIWGIPGDSSHDPERKKMNIFEPAPPGPYPRTPFFTNPTTCGGELPFHAAATSYQEPGVVHEADAALPPITGCDEVEFDPTLEARPTTNVADSPSGFDVDLEMSQNEDPDGRATSALRDATVTLPQGLAVNPSSANGLSACSPGQIGLITPVGDSHPHFNLAATQCPVASAIGDVEVVTPTFDDALHGRVFLASPHENPFGSLLALYLTIKGHGLNIKLAGQVHADPQTGQITTTFTENPQLPVEHLRLHLFKGAYAPLRTPATCGTYTTTSSLTPWSAPGSGPPATPKDEYAITQGPNGQGCGAPANAPSFDAGSVSPLAGQYRPFVVNLRREDGTQQFSSITLTPPPGLIAKLAGTATCSDAALAAAAAKSGAAEKASPSCPAASEVGNVYASAGAGPAPYNAPGKAYLAGPYKGAPLSLAIVTPATAGPFDLGTIVVRTALNVNPATAQVTAVSDPIPTILQGIPLDIRSVSLRLDRPEFTRNPTSCDPMQVDGALTSLLGATSALASRFQVSDCPLLGFKPKLKLALKGSTKRTEHPSLRATLTARPGDANIAKAQVKLPHAAFLDQAHLKTICTRVQFGARACPAGSIYGKARATSPLLDYAVAGPVYLRSSSHELPDLVAELRAPDTQPIMVELAGKTDSVKAALRNTFEAVPDVPVSKFSLTLFGGEKGLIVMSSGFCKSPRASVKFDAQNGKVYDSTPKVAGKCGKHKKKRR